MEWGIIDQPSPAASKIEEKKRVVLFMIMEIDNSEELPSILIPES